MRGGEESSLVEAKFGLLERTLRCFFPFGLETLVEATRTDFFGFGVTLDSEIFGFEVTKVVTMGALDFTGIGFEEGLASIFVGRRNWQGVGFFTIDEG